MTTKPCVVCKKELEPAINNDWKSLQPFAGGEIQLLFCYGSTKFDLNIGMTKFRGVICDTCASDMMPQLESA